MVAEEKSVVFEPKSMEELDKFFKSNKDKFHEIWVVITKKKHADPQPVSFNQAVREALKHGLVDSRTRSLNEQRYSIRFTKRKKAEK